MDRTSRVDRAKFRGSPLTFLIFVGIAFIGQDFVAIERQPLRYLGVTYPAWLDGAALLIPSACAIACMTCRRRWPIVAEIVSVVVCVTLVSLIPAMFAARVSVNRIALPFDVAEMQARLGFPVFVRQSSDDGATAIVSPEHEAAARADLARLGRLR